MSAPSNVSYNDDTIDSRDLVAYFEWNAEDMESDEREQFSEFIEEFEAYAEDFEYGAIAISAEYFTEYAQELVQDMGDIPGNLPDYVSNNINWEGVAGDLLVDYTEISFAGNYYYVR